jgi:integrase
MAFKESATGKWTAQWYETDVYGNRKQVKKRGFATKREAKQYEVERNLKQSGSVEMKLKVFVETYFQDKENELKDRSKRNKRYMINNYIIPYFGDTRMSDITPAQIIAWQNEIYSKGLSESYMRMIQNQLTALFTHASKVYDLGNNPCKKVRRMGKDSKRSLTFWTVDEYKTFIASIDRDDKYFVIFEILFWTGMRIGELLALTKADIDFYNDRINIDKTYHREGGKDIVTSPKTEQSIRTVEIPKFLKEEIKAYTDSLYGLPEHARLFPVVREAVQHKMQREVAKTGVRSIRVHDLRHSHIAYLINQGIEPLLIKERVGHKDIGITLNTYGHLYPNKARSVADMLDNNN